MKVQRAMHYLGASLRIFEELHAASNLCRTHISLGYSATTPARITRTAAWLARRKGSGVPAGSSTLSTAIQPPSPSRRAGREADRQYAKPLTLTSMERSQASRSRLYRGGAEARAINRESSVDLAGPQHLLGDNFVSGSKRSLMHRQLVCENHGHVMSFELGKLQGSRR